MNKQNEPQKIFIGVSWPYASGNVHLGHLAGQNVTCDVFARYHRQAGNQVLMVSGSDSHGAPVTFAAEEKGTTPEKLAEESHKKILATFKKLGLIYENYTKTTTENHKIVAQNIFSVLNELGFLEVKKSKQYYDTKVNRFLPDRYVRGACPKCNNENARGDECPECGEFLKPEDLLNPRSTLSDIKPIMKETEHFYLNLTKVQPQLKEWLKDKTYWRKWVKEFSDGWIKQGLEPRSVTRDMDFGIPVPVDGWEGKVIYVWIEAVVGYLSAAIEWAEKSGDPAKWEEFWKDPNCKHYYFIAGGNVPFHTIIWPAELIAYNVKYKNSSLRDKFKLPGESTDKPLNLPYDVPANQLLMLRGRKMSKGDKTGIELEDLLGKYNPDLIRYFFVRYAPENHNREFSWKDFIDANNNELVANLGNFINRVLTFAATKFEGKVPGGKVEAEVQNAINKAFIETGQSIEICEFVKAISSVLELGKFANKYFNDAKPWEKDAKDPANAVFNSLQLVSAIATLLKPFLPFSSAKIQRLINQTPKYDANIELEENGKVTKLINNWKFTPLDIGQTLNEPEIIFEKLEYTDDLKQADTPPDTASSNPLLTDTIVIGKILELKDIQDSKNKLARVSLGDKEINIVCGGANVAVGILVPIALPGSKVKTQDGKTKKIRESKVSGINSQGMACSPLEIGLGDDYDNYLILPQNLEKHLGKPLRDHHV